jgi:SAM-dependent methyltransferase
MLASRIAPQQSPGRTIPLLDETHPCCSDDVAHGFSSASCDSRATLAAARRFARVMSTDYVPALLERGRRRADADGVDVTCEVADAEALPYPDAAFDVVRSTCGVMFAPEHQQAASELLRVCRPGGRIGLACWTPQGFLGHLFRVVAGYVRRCRT